MKTFLRIFLWMAAIGWMALIFSFSMETGGQSSETSGSFIEFFMERWLPGFTDLSEADQFAAIESVTYFVRKAAHFTIFAVLGFLLGAALWSCGVSVRRMFLLSFIIGGLYAVSDEIHQAFVPGRACMIRDMLLDACGVLTGGGVIRLIRSLINKRKSEQYRR